MYEPLKNLSSELFLPNINLIEPNSVTLLETNQPFIESYMVGLNHEFARELLWREYPTDQRGSTFRQFWDVRSFYAPDADAEALREKLRDIRRCTGGRASPQLGDHDNREARDGEGGRAGARHPRRAVEAVPDGGHLRAPCLLAAHGRWHRGRSGEGPLLPERRHRQYRRSAVLRR